MKKRRYWTPGEEALMRMQYATMPTAAIAATLDRPVKAIHSKATDMGLHKSRELIVETARANSRNPDHPGAATRFQPGLQPWNKGTNFKAGGRSAETRFKPGHRSHTWQPVGSYRVVTDRKGYQEVQIKINDDPGPTHVRWKAVTRLAWEAEHGPVPEGHAVVFRAGMRTVNPAEITADKLELVSRAELMRRNTVHRLPREVAQTVQLLGALRRRINNSTRTEETQ
jgi:hypothetical protein